ncbi:MAG: hypothetical protein LBC85_00215 [Fibromonadaceae bacterium]|jgi:C-terminal peptidase prc|nr:hypothetical protein [Fibromonadaceae bacterium]
MRFFLLFLALSLFACGVTETDLNHSIEHNHNYKLLKAYFFKPERIKEYSVYEEMEIDSMYSSLNDYLRGHRYTRYHQPEEADEVIDGRENSERYYSFGFERTLAGDTLIVNAVYPISPAAEAELKKHDKLLFANGRSLTGENAVLYKNLDDPFDNSTVFEVLRGEERVPLSAMQKREVPKPTVYLDSLDGVPFIRVTSFTRYTNNPNGTYAEFKEVLQEIQGTKTAIIDMRGNLGGSIHHCTGMAAELAPLDKELIFDVYHHHDRQRGNVIDTIRVFARDYYPENSSAGLGIKWVILANEWSASCSERFIAAVKASRPETVVIGQTTYGKGIGQVYMKTYLGGLAFITCLQTFSPNGKSFHEVGIEPDIFIEPNNEEAIYMAAMQAAQNFDLGIAARRSFASITLKALPPQRKADEMEPAAYRLLHEWE